MRSSHGAVGATTNPVIVDRVLKKEMHLWKTGSGSSSPRCPASEDDIAWKVIEEMAVKGAAMLLPISEGEQGQKGRLSIQTNAKYYRNAPLMVGAGRSFRRSRREHAGEDAGDGAPESRPSKKRRSGA